MSKPIFTHESGIEIELIIDSLCLPRGLGKVFRLTTTRMRFPRYILAEVSTHRRFSSNSASSRAVRISRFVKQVEEDPVLFWNPGYEQMGMQAAEPLSDEDRMAAQEAWLNAAYEAVKAAREFERIGLHKQHANRVLEPWLWHEVVITTTDTKNFFDQRDSPLAQPEIQVVAQLWKEALHESAPKILEEREWHLPYVSDDDRVKYTVEEQQMLSVARCAKVSYLNHQGVPDPERDFARYNMLKEASPPHWSPFEHVARPMTPFEFDDLNGRCANLDGWMQLRFLLGG